jgi:superfamily II DNA or RNA helicase
METLNNKYKINIYERYLDLKNSNKPEFDNNDLWKIFEYYSCIKLSEEYNKPFYEYDDIDPTYKELNKMTRNDTGIDLSDLDKTIVQCKLRKNSLTWKECSTFFGSMSIFSKELNKAIIRWEKLIITRNNDCILSENLLERKDLFIDKPYLKEDLLKFCENLIIKPPKYPVNNNNFSLRDYQTESINMITQNKKNVIINLPTGTGKNSVIIYSFEEKKKYLILVPRIILMDQLKDEIIKHKPSLKNKIQLIGDSNNTFDANKTITLCVFNSVSLIENHCNTFEKIYIDEAHHINKPEIYYYDDYDDTNNDNKTNDNKTDDDNKTNDNKTDYDNSDDDNSDDNISDDDNSEDNNSDDDNNSNDNYLSDYDSDTDLIDDTEDELKNVKNYTQIIKSLVQYNNNVYLSATIDKTDNFEYYSKDIRDMINIGYLCDYTIHIPIFSEDPDNKKICEHLLKNYKNIIIYCNSQKEGKEINQILNNLQNNSSLYVDCLTSKKKRNDIINKYKKGEIPFLVNVRILVEGFDAPITKGVCFLHLPNNKTTLIQIIGRCLRLHPTKTIANIILPFSSKGDEKNISNFLKVMAKNDSRIKKSFENKKLGGYISIDISEDIEENDNENEKIINSIEFKYNMIYDSMGVLQNGEEIWLKRLEEVRDYIDKHNKRPSYSDKDIKIKALGSWMSIQKQNYKKKDYIMKNLKIYNKWENFTIHPKYMIYFMSNEHNWEIKLKQVKDYIDKNNKRPTARDTNKKIKKLGKWLNYQNKYYKKKESIMKNSEIYNKYKNFINDNKYMIYFLSNVEGWKFNLEKIKKYIEKNNKIPSTIDKNKEIKNMGIWISCQRQNYKKKENIMKNSEIYNIWGNFINNFKYMNHFLSNEEEWEINLKQVKDYIDKNNKRPSSTNKNKEISKLGKWIKHQQQNYKKKEYMMKSQEICNKWDNFINNFKYIIYFTRKKKI